MAQYVLGQANDFIGGQNAALIPDRIPDNCYAAGVNVSTKKASLQPRWGFERMTLTYPGGGFFNVNNQYISYKEIFESGKFQLMASYPADQIERLLVVIAGLIFIINVNAHTVTLVPIAGGSTLNHRAPRLNWTPAGKSMIIFDFPNYPVIITGTTARRANPLNMEIPVSTNGAYNQSRLFIANAGNEFTAGDPVGLIDPTAIPPIDPPLTFQEVMLPASTYYGQIFQLTTQSSNENITAMGFLQVSDISTGIGPLLIATSRSIYSYNTTQPRSAWEQGQFGSLLTYNTGVVGPRAWANVNSDLFYLSADGYVRTLSMSRDEQSRWSKIPISREVEPWMKYNDPALKQFGFVSYFNNKVFFSANPYRIPAMDYATRRPIADYAHSGFVVLELDNLTSFGAPSSPTWAGLWTGVNPMDMAVLNERGFVMSKDAYSINSLWEINPEIHHDTSDCKIRYVKSRVYTKEHDCGDPFMNKEIHSMDLNFDALKGDFKLSVEYKPGHSSKFIPWGTIDFKVPWRECKMPCNSCLEGFATQIIRDVTIGSPSGETLACNPATRELYQIFRKIQLKLDVTGMYWEIHEYRVKAIPRTQENQETVCSEFGIEAMCEDCNDDWCVEDFNICQPTTT
jgi:hypothetical protein